MESATHFIFITFQQVNINILYHRSISRMLPSVSFMVSCSATNELSYIFSQWTSYTTIQLNEQLPRVVINFIANFAKETAVKSFRQPLRYCFYTLSHVDAKYFLMEVQSKRFVLYIHSTKQTPTEIKAVIPSLRHLYFQHHINHQNNVLHIDTIFCKENTPYKYPLGSLKGTS